MQNVNSDIEDDEIDKIVTDIVEDIDLSKVEKIRQDLRLNDKMMEKSLYDTLNQAETQHKNKLAEEKRIKEEQERISKQYECS